jgi:hypothetical protein
VAIAISGTVREAAVLVDGAAFSMSKKPDGTIGGTAQLPVSGQVLDVVATIEGEPGTAFTVAVTRGDHATSNKGTIPEGGGALCHYQIKPGATT